MGWPCVAAPQRATWRDVAFDGVGRPVNVAPDSSAVRAALWRAIHVQIDEPPHLIKDEIGLALASPGEDWRDMHPIAT